jgi:LacI family transcriptional regulator
LGLRIPDDVSLVGYGDLPFSRYTVPALTTVHTPMERVGRPTVDLLPRPLGKEAR